jgi:hypothetical protein
MDVVDAASGTASQSSGRWPGVGSTPLSSWHDANFEISDRSQANCFAVIGQGHHWGHSGCECRTLGVRVGNNTSRSDARRISGFIPPVDRGVRCACTASPRAGPCPGTSTTGGSHPHRADGDPVPCWHENRLRLLCTARGWLVFRMLERQTAAGCSCPAWQALLSCACLTRGPEKLNRPQAETSALETGNGEGCSARQYPLAGV